MKCSDVKSYASVLFPKIVQGERSYASREGQDAVSAAPGVRAARQPARGVIWRAIPGGRGRPTGDGTCAPRTRARVRSSFYATRLSRSMFSAALHMDCARLFRGRARIVMSSAR